MLWENLKFKKQNERTRLQGITVFNKHQWSVLLNKSVRMTVGQLLFVQWPFTIVSREVYADFRFSN